MRFIAPRNIHNNYLIDREEQRHETFIGLVKSFVIHDSCATESMGPRYDRSREHLGVGKNRRISSMIPGHMTCATSRVS